MANASRESLNSVLTAFIWNLYVGAVQGNALSVTDSNWTGQCPTCVSLGYAVGFATC